MRAEYLETLREMAEKWRRDAETHALFSERHARKARRGPSLSESRWLQEDARTAHENAVHARTRWLALSAAVEELERNGGEP